MKPADDVLRRDRLHVRHRAAQRIVRDGTGGKTASHREAARALKAAASGAGYIVAVLAAA